MWTPLHVAIYKEHRDIVLLQLEGRADTETRNNWDETALYMASSLGRADIVWQLISHGADPNVSAKTSIWTTMMLSGLHYMWCRSTEKPRL